MPFQLQLALVGVFVTVAVASGLLTEFVLVRRSPGRRRLNDLVTAGGSIALPVEASLAEQVDPTAERFARLVPKSPKEMGRLKRRMALAGYHSPYAAVAYGLAEVLLPLATGVFTLYYWGLTSGALFGVFAMFVAYMLPGFWLLRKIDNRKKQIRNGLPDALDLFIVCIEAGSSLDQAIVKASDELAIAYPALAEELRLITLEIRAGKPRLEAFRNFAQRTKVDDVQALVAMMVQTDRFGTSIAQALRTHADVARTKRRQRAEERAAKLGVKLVFPLVFCLFPAFYVVTLGPAIIQFVRVFFGMVMAR